MKNVNLTWNASVWSDKSALFTIPTIYIFFKLSRIYNVKRGILWYQRFSFLTQTVEVPSRWVKPKVPCQRLKSFIKIPSVFVNSKVPGKSPKFKKSHKSLAGPSPESSISKSPSPRILKWGGLEISGQRLILLNGRK